jgi:cob(I)alamin adenosyltransferase
MSIATRHGDEGETNLPDGERVSKADPRVECYGVIDELVSQIGVARSICEDAEMKQWLKAMQRDLFKVGAAISVAPEFGRPATKIEPQMIAVLDEHVRRAEATEGILKDWALPGELPASAALDVARAVCRRAERLAVHLTEQSVISNPPVLAYLNRLSDVLWLFGRLLELRAKVNSSLRDTPGSVPPWSRAW